MQLRKIGLVVSAAFFPLLVLASSFFEQPFPDSVRGAPVIVRGKVGKSEAQWSTLSDGTRQLFTYYDVDVVEGLKGKPRTGTSIQIRELGGSKDGVSTQISGTAQFSPGEDIVVMLSDPNESSANSYPVQGMMMGRFGIEKGPDGKEYLQGPGLGTSERPGIRHEHADGKNPTKVSIEDLREIIRTQVAEPAGAASPVVLASGSPHSGTLLEPLISEPKAAPSFGVQPILPHEETSGRFKPLILLLGVFIGGIWFLKSRKNRR